MRLVRKRIVKKGQTDLDVTYLKEVWDFQKGICPYTNWNLVLPQTSDGWNSIINKCKRASLDRIDCSKGCIKGNVQFCCIMANYAKNDMSDNDLIDFCHSVSNYKKNTE